MSTLIFTSITINTINADEQFTDLYCTYSKHTNTEGFRNPNNFFFP